MGKKKEGNFFLFKDAATPGDARRRHSLVSGPEPGRAEREKVKEGSQR